MNSTSIFHSYFYTKRNKLCFPSLFWDFGIVLRTLSGWFRLWLKLKQCFIQTFLALERNSKSWVSEFI